MYWQGGVATSLAMDSHEKSLSYALLEMEVEKESRFLQ
jgi:hypothetical protein